MKRLVDPSPDENLSHDEKQRIFEEARAPVNQLLNDIEEIRARLRQEKFKLSLDEEKSLNKKHEELYVKWKIALKNAAKDIFERMNSKGIQNIIVNDSEVFRVDFHCLSIEGAKIVFNEFILPLLDVAKQIMIITGRGLHSKNGKSVLKEALVEYLTSMTIKFQNVSNNDGAIYVFSDLF